jgi:DNA-binding beta-propeller fold protein YncE
MTTKRERGKNVKRLSSFLSLMITIIFFSVVSIKCPLVHGNSVNLYLELVATITIDGAPSCIAVNEETNRIYVAVNQSIVVIDGETDEVVSKFPLGFRVDVLAVNPRTNHIFASGYNSPATYVIDGSTGSVVGNVGDNIIFPTEIAVNPVTNLIYLARCTAVIGEYDKVQVLNGSTLEEVAVINIPGSDKHPYMESVYVAVNTHTNRVYITWTGEKILLLVDGDTNEIIKIVKPSSFGQGRFIKINPATNYVYFESAVLDGEFLNEVLPKYERGVMAIDPTLNLIYDRFGSDSLYALDGNTHEVKLSLNFKYKSIENAAVNSKTGKIYVTHYYDKQVSVVACKRDETPPTISIISPSVDYLRDWVTISWNGSDIGLGIDHYEVKLDDDLWIQVETNTEYTFHGLDEGSHMAHVKAVDKAGNSQDAVVNFIVDATPPEVVISSPSWGSVIRESTITVTWNGSDALSGIDHYEVSIDDGPEINKGTDTTHTFTHVGDGNHEVRVKAADKAGVSGYDFVAFTVNTSLFGLPGWIDEIAIFAGIPIVIALAYLLIKRAKKARACARIC